MISTSTSHIPLEYSSMILAVSASSKKFEKFAKFHAEGAVRGSLRFAMNITRYLTLTHYCSHSCCHCFTSTSDYTYYITISWRHKPTPKDIIFLFETFPIIYFYLIIFLQHMLSSITLAANFLPRSLGAAGGLLISANSLPSWLFLPALWASNNWKPLLSSSSGELLTAAK